MTELTEKINSLIDDNKKNLFTRFAFLSTAIWGFLCLFGLLYHWGVMAGLGIPEDFFPLTFQMLPVEAYVAFIMLFNKLSSYDSMFMVMPAIAIGATFLLGYYFFSSKVSIEVQEKFRVLRAGLREHAHKHQITEVYSSILVACAVYFAPRVILLIIGILGLMPLTGYYLGKGIGAESALKAAEQCVKRSSGNISGCMEFTDHAKQDVRGYILAQSEGFVAWYFDGAIIEVRPLDKTITYKVAMKP